MRHDLLLELIKNRKENITKYVAPSKKDIEELKSLVNKKWNNYIPSKKTVFYAAADGSLYTKNYLGFSIMVFSGYSESFNPENEQIDNLFLGDIYPVVMKKIDQLKTLATLSMFLCETKALLNLAEKVKPKLLIIDGTITSRFIIPYPLTSWFCSNNNEEIENISVELIKENLDIINSNEILSLKDEYIERIKSKIKEDKKDYLDAIVFQSLYYEFLITLYKLFNLDYNPIIIGIAKTSTGKDLLNHSIPDIRIFLSLADELGYSEIVEQKVENLKSFFGKFTEVSSQINNFIYGLDILSFYAKYRSKDRINLVEFYQNPNIKTVDIREILDYLNDISFGGLDYPFKLKKVDNEVRITQLDFEFIERELGLTYEITGREGL